MSASLTKVTASRAVARPLRVLVPLIQEDLAKAMHAGQVYFLAAGEKLIEAKESKQVSPASWGRWLNKNFSLSERTAFRYMKAARATAEDITASTGSTGRPLLTELTGERQQQKDYQDQKRKAWAPFRAATARVDAEAVSQDRQTRADEVELHRALALEMIDIGFKALATRLHPDRPGGSRVAMARANRVREELKQVAATRRFV